MKARAGATGSLHDDSRFRQCYRQWYDRAGTNFDYYHLPSNSYPVVLALYPDHGNSCIIPSGAGRTASNSAFNDKGLVYIMAAASQKGPGDNGPGVTGFLELPYVAMTCDTVPHAENFLINSTRMSGLNHLLLDTSILP